MHLGIVSNALKTCVYFQNKTTFTIRQCFLNRIAWLQRISGADYTVCVYEKSGTHIISAYSWQVMMSFVDAGLDFEPDIFISKSAVDENKYDRMIFTQIFAWEEK